MGSSIEAHIRRAALNKIIKVTTAIIRGHGYASFVIYAHIIHPSGGFVNNFSVFFGKVFFGRIAIMGWSVHLYFANFAKVFYCSWRVFVVLNVNF